LGIIEKAKIGINISKGILQLLKFAGDKFHGIKIWRQFLNKKKQSGNF
jgi:hypothetical protein